MLSRICLPFLFFFFLYHSKTLEIDQSTNVGLCGANGNSSNIQQSIKATPPPLPKFPPPLIHRRHRNFRALSANVQRLISHVNTSLHPDDMNDSSHSVENETHFDGVKKRLAETAQPIVVVPTTNGSKFKHPLSKNTDKLTQFGSDLVIDDSDGGYETPPENPYECKHNSLYDDVNSNVYEDADGEGDYVNCDGDGENNKNNNDNDEDDDKTPINEFEFDYDQVQVDHINGNSNENVHDMDDDVYDEVEKPPDWNDSNKVDDTVTTNTAIASTPTVITTAETVAPASTSTPNLSLKNASFIHSMLSKCETSPIVSSPDGSAQNSPTLPQKSTEANEVQAIKGATTIKSQLFSIKAQVLEQNAKFLTESPNESTVMNGTATENEANQLIVPSNDKNSTSNHTNGNSKIGSKENGRLTIDLKRTKIRPLSSVSISSTSSSSSSASDEHSSNQNAISYLASVESLADHSENELAILSSSLTVTERACLEIIDSERSYTNDLGQVIKG